MNNFRWWRKLRGGYWVYHALVRRWDKVDKIHYGTCTVLLEAGRDYCTAIEDHNYE